MGKRKQILLIHGGNTFETYDAFLYNLKNKTINLERIESGKDWKSELVGQLGDEYVVYAPQFPNKQNAQYEEWKILFGKILNALDDNIILIGNSLGAIFLVKYLSENKIDKKIQKTILLAGPFDDSLETEKLASFVRSASLKMFEQQAGKLFFYHSEDDFIVPFAHVLEYQKNIPTATYRFFKDLAHFFRTEIPGLIDDIKQ